MADTIRTKKQLKKKPKFGDDTSILPLDIIINILSRLPVKSLMRFKSVSKPWYAGISNVEFAKTHLRQSKNSDCREARVLCWSDYENEYHHIQLKFTEDGLQSERLLKFPLKKYQRAPALCSYDGLILLKSTTNSEQKYVIWNPSTRTYTKFLCPYPFDNGYSTFGICYDQSNQDYKVLMLEHMEDASETYVVFSFNNNHWTERKYSSTHSSPLNQFVVVHGVPHWVVKEKCEHVRLSERKRHRLELSDKRCKECTNCWSLKHYTNHPVYKCHYSKTLEICYLDHRDDTIKKLLKPVGLDVISVFCLASLRSQLCLYRNTYDHTRMEIWVMKEYGNPDSWMKFLTIENIPRPHVCHHSEPLCFTSEGDIVIDFGGGGFVIYNPSTNLFRESKYQLYDDPYPLVYLDSLVLPRRINSSKRN